MEISNKYFMQSNFTKDTYIYDMKDACSSLHFMYSEFNLPQGLNSLQMALTIQLYYITQECLCF